MALLDRGTQPRPEPLAGVQDSQRRALEQPVQRGRLWRWSRRSEDARVSDHPDEPVDHKHRDRPRLVPLCQRGKGSPSHMVLRTVIAGGTASRRRTGHGELAGHRGGDQRLAVFAQQRKLAFKTVDKFIMTPVDVS